MGNAVQRALDSIKKGEAEINLESAQHLLYVLFILCSLTNLSAEEVKQVVDALNTNNTVKKVSMGFVIGIF